MKWIGTQTIYDSIRFRRDISVEPKVVITNTTTSSATEGGKLVLVCDDGAAMGDDHRLGAVHFNGAEDGSSTLRTGAKIQAMADAAWSGTENGTRLEFYTKDGDNSSELSLTLDSDKRATFTGDIALYDATNDGNPTISLGKDVNDRFEIQTVYNSGAQTIDYVYFQTYTTSSTANDGRYFFLVDEVELARIIDSGIYVTGNVQALDADAALTAIDTTTSSATQGGKLRLMSDDDAVMGDDHRLGVIEFYGAEDAGSGAGSNTKSIGARIQAIARDAWDGSNNDADLEFYTTDGTTESKVLTLDSDKKATFTGNVRINNATTSSASEGGVLNLISDDGAALGDDHRLGKIAFQAAEDSSSTIRQGASIEAFADAAWSASENGTRLEFYTMDGNNAIEKSLTLDSDLLATFAGGVTVGGALTANGNFTIGESESVNTILDEDAMGTNSATALATQQSIKAYADTKVSSATTRQLTHHTIKDDIGTSVVYISLGEIDAESGTKSNKNLPLLAPVAGKLLKVFLRLEEDMSGSGHDTNLTWRLLTRAASATTSGNAAVIGTQTGAGPTASSMVTYDFTSSLDSGTNAIAAGDKVQLSVQSDATSADQLFFITCLWEWDLS